METAEDRLDGRAKAGTTTHFGGNEQPYMLIEPALPCDLHVRGNLTEVAVLHKQFLRPLSPRERRPAVLTQRLQAIMAGPLPPADAGQIPYCACDVDSVRIQLVRPRAGRVYPGLSSEAAASNSR